MMHGILKLTVLLNVFAVILGKFNDDHSFYWRRSDILNCEPFTAYYMNCNKCVCSADGVPYCTRLLCPKKSESITEDPPVNARRKIKLRLEEIIEELQQTSSDSK